MNNKALDLSVLLITLIMLAFVAYIGFNGFMETGPNCPGKDPQWLGFCSEAPS